MPRVSKKQAEENRKAITRASSRLFRERGFEGVSVVDLMAEAGLTHGGFYGHFNSKAELAAAACEAAFARSAERWSGRIAVQEPERGRRALIDGYLAASPFEDLRDSCPMAAWAVDVARQSERAPVRSAFTDGLAELLALLASVEAGATPAERRRAALADLATRVGALVLARATSSQPRLARDFLKSARAALRV